MQIATIQTILKLKISLGIPGWAEVQGLIYLKSGYRNSVFSTFYVFFFFKRNYSLILSYPK